MKLFAFVIVIFLLFVNSDFEEKKEAPDMETLNEARPIHALSDDEHSYNFPYSLKSCYYPIITNDLYRDKMTRVRSFYQKNEGDEWIRIANKKMAKRESYDLWICADGLFAIAFEAEDCQTLVVIRVKGLNIRQEVIGYGE